MTGASPFYGKNYHEVLMKNKEANVEFVEQYWKFLSSEAKDITQKMVIKDPAERITAKEALNYSWFSMEHSGSTGLSTAFENMKKYNDKNRFNMEKIKPEFSMVTCSPLLNSRGQGTLNSPALASKGRAFVAQSPAPASSKFDQSENKQEDSKKIMKGGLLIRSLNNKAAAPAPPIAVSKSKKTMRHSSFRNPLQHQDDDDGDFNEEDIDERPSEESKAPETKTVNKPFIPRVLEGRKLPITPGFKNTNAFNYLGSIGTPMQNRRPMPKTKLGEAQKLALGLVPLKSQPKEEVSKSAARSTTNNEKTQATGMAEIPLRIRPADKVEVPCKARRIVSSTKESYFKRLADASEKVTSVSNDENLAKAINDSEKPTQTTDTAPQNPLASSEPIPVLPDLPAIDPIAASDPPVAGEVQQQLTNVSEYQTAMSHFDIDTVKTLVDKEKPVAITIKTKKILRDLL